MDLPVFSYSCEIWNGGGAQGAIPLGMSTVTLERSYFICDDREDILKHWDPFMKLAFLLELTPRYSLKRKSKNTTKDIISIGISDTTLDPGKSKGKENAWIFPTWGHTINFPHSECPLELAAAYHLYVCKVLCYRKHQHSRCTDCPQRLQAGRVCLASPGLHRNSHKGCWALHLQTSLVIALKVGFC